jgi:hypothetical protein
VITTQAWVIHRASAAEKERVHPAGLGVETEVRWWAHVRPSCRFELVVSL